MIKHSLLDIRKSLHITQRKIALLRSEALTPVFDHVLKAIYLLNKLIEKHKE